MGLGKINNWGSILRFTTSNDNWGYYGVRNPAMWFHPNSYKFHFTYYTSHGQNITILMARLVQTKISTSKLRQLEITLNVMLTTYKNFHSKFLIHIDWIRAYHYEFMLETITSKQQMLDFKYCVHSFRVEDFSGFIL